LSYIYFTHKIEACGIKYYTLCIYEKNGIEYVWVTNVGERTLANHTVVNNIICSLPYPQAPQWIGWYVWDPKITEVYEVDDLKDINMVGIYRPLGKTSVEEFFKFLDTHPDCNGLVNMLVDDVTGLIEAAQKAKKALSANNRHFSDTGQGTIELYESNGRAFCGLEKALRNFPEV